MGFYGDWRTIYDFAATPILSGATAVFHAIILLWFWQADRGGFFEMGAFASSAGKEQVVALEGRVAANPFDSQLQLQLIDAYRQAGLTRKATQQLQKFLKDNPHSAEGHLQLAVLEGTGKAQIPAKAKDNALKAVNLGLKEPGAIAAAHQIIGRYDFDRNKVEEAIDHYSRAIEAIQTADNRAVFVNLLYYRGLAYRRKEQYEAAYQDVQQAIQLARSGNLDGSITFLEKELETISRHAGRPLDQFKLPPT
jgi:tetratricopeptide (TPR) repeat protein